MVDNGKWGVCLECGRPGRWLCEDCLKLVSDEGVTLADHSDEMWMEVDWR